MNPHEQSAYHRIALYLGLSDIALGVWICGIAIAVIVGVGYACIELSMTPTPEGERKR